MLRFADSVVLGGVPTNNRVADMGIAIGDIDDRSPISTTEPVAGDVAVGPLVRATQPAVRRATTCLAYR